MPQPLSSPGPEFNARVRRFAAEEDPGYGQDFTDEQWSEITERLASLAELLLRIRRREMEREMESGLPEQLSGNSARAESIRGASELSG